MSGRPWLEALKEHFIRGDQEQEETRAVFFADDPGDNLTKPTEAPALVMDINTAVTPRVEDEQRLIVAGWAPKERMGLAIWANPETGFYFSQEAALHRLDERSEA